MLKSLERQINKTRANLKPHAFVVDGCKEVTKLIEMFLNHMGNIVDKQIKKVKKDVEKNDKKKAKKDISKLMKMDKKFDKEIESCKKMKKKK
jgi:hypothetical protein